MQRLFSTFPAGWPGVALLLLRAAVGATAIAEGVQLATEADPTLVSFGLTALAVVSGAALLIGFLTPAASLIAAFGCVCLAALGLPPSAPTLLSDRFALLLMIIVAAAIVLLGPGAFSLDARLFGRREIVIPAQDPGSRSR